MSKRIFSLFALVAITFVGCNDRITPTTHHKADDWSPSTVITPNGNMGIEVAPGVAIDMSSGDMSPSFGF